MPMMCFSYQPDPPQGIAPPSLRDPRLMPSACFSYTADVPQRPARHDAPQPAPPGLRSMVFGTCFRY